MISSLKIRLKSLLKISKELVMCLFGVVGKILIDEQDLMEFIYLVRFWIQNVGDIDFKVIFAPENSIKFPKKPGFGKEKIS